jgi:D-beta-D-heptose 7-phosphate kinase/D-beta-D-heptose 1-phosphate adenosyltransferase
MNPSERGGIPTDPSHAHAVLNRFSSLPVLVVGDLMIDDFIFGRVRRISPEAPVPVLEFDHEEMRIGGAGNVAHNLTALGASVGLIGLTGQDADGDRLLTALGQSRIEAAGVIREPGRRTTKKVRLVTTRHQQVARIDYEVEEDARGGTEANLLERLADLGASSRVIVISDYLKGSVTKRVAERAIEIGRARRVPVLVDPKIPHLDYYAGATVITPNNQEAEQVIQRRIRTDDDARAAARAIRERTSSASVLITRGEDGMWLLDQKAEGPLAAVARDVADVTGAGDTVIATLAAALAAGAEMPEAAFLANLAAGITVSKFGPATVTITELRHAVGAA